MEALEQCYNGPGPHPFEDVGGSLVCAQCGTVEALAVVPVVVSDAPAKRGPGRPPRKPRSPNSLNPMVRAQILASIRAGAFLKHAVQAAGISYTTFRNWMNSDEAECVELREEVEEAQGAAVLALSVRVARTDPKFWLTRGPGRAGVDGEGWSASNRIEITGRGGGPVELAPARPNLRNLTMEELELFEKLNQKLLEDGTDGNSSFE